MYALTFVREIKRETMGAMHETFSPLTAKDIAKQQNVDIATIRLRWNANFEKGTFDSNRELSPEQVEILSQSKRTKRYAKPREKKIIRTTQTITVNQPAPASEAIPPAPGRAKFSWPDFGLSEFLAIAVYGHTALVWYEVALIFGTPGILAGVVLFALKHCAVVVCRSEKFSDYHSDAFGVAFVLDALAVWVHFTAFCDAMPDRFRDGAEFWAALILGLVVASGAFVSLYFTNKTATL